jgi:O-methyltransferase
MNMKKIIQGFLLSRGIVLTEVLKYLSRERSIDLAAYAGDYVRNSSLELVAHEINEQRIAGSVAELGVFRGDFARIINEVFPGRKLYLFDTFRGFHKGDVGIDKQLSYSAGDQDFTKTSIDLVLSKMKYPDNCVVKQGYFPDTARDVRDVFAFVSIDADLYKPIYDGLCFFYPHLAKGGCLFVHDYNNDEYQGARQAVREFCRENNIGFFPLPDACGTAVIFK